MPSCRPACQVRVARRLCSNNLVILKDALASAIGQLTAAHVGSPRLNAETLLMFTLGCDRAYLFAHPERELTSQEKLNYQEAIAQRATGIPTQYITGHQEFWGMDLIVTPAVLIPRPETEHAIETVLELARAQADSENAESANSELENAGRALWPANSIHADNAANSAQLHIADVGTGSGCIALALAKELPQAEIHATDISPAALEVARANAARHQLESRIHFLEVDLLTGLRPETFDFVVSNPPYVGESEEDQVQLEVRKFEPRNAVFAGPTGLE